MALCVAPNRQVLEASVSQKAPPAGTFDWLRRARLPEAADVPKEAGHIRVESFFEEGLNMDIGDDDEIARVLRRLARPTTRITPEVEDELASLTIATLGETVPIARKRAWQFSLTAGLPVLLVFGVGAAAAATGLWVPWAQTPDGSFTYTLPSGVSCEQRVGNLRVDNPDIQRAVQEIFAEMDVVAQSDVAARNERLLAEDSALEYAQATVYSDGSPGYSTIADVIYGMAVSAAVLETLDEELIARGFDMSDERNMISVEGQVLCGEDIP